MFKRMYCKYFIRDYSPSIRIHLYYNGAISSRQVRVLILILPHLKKLSRKAKKDAPFRTSLKKLQLRFRLDTTRNAIIITSLFFYTTITFLAIPPFNLRFKWFAIDFF